MSTESVLITSTIDTHKGRDFRIYGIPDAFISENMDEDAKMSLCGKLSELMVEIALQIYHHHVIYKKGSTIL